MRSDKITRNDRGTTGRTSRPPLPAGALPPTGKGQGPSDAGGAPAVLAVSGQFNCSDAFLRDVGKKPQTVRKVVSAGPFLVPGAVRAKTKGSV